MLEKNKRKNKIIIKTRFDLRMCKEFLTFEDFCERFEMPLDFSTMIISEELIAKVKTRLDTTDRAMTADELITLN